MSFITTFSKHSRGFVLLLLAAGLAGCGGGGDSPSAEVPQGFVSVNIPWQTRAAVPASVEKIRLSIEAADMAPVAAVLTQADVVDGVAKKTVSVPAGENRIIRGTAFDGKDQPVGRGNSSAFNVSAGKTTSVSLTLAEVKTGAAIETKAEVALLNHLSVLQTALKEQPDLINVEKDSEKIWCEFKDNHHLVYIYGSGRLFIVSGGNLGSLTDFYQMEGELTRILDIFRSRLSDFDDWKWANARTWLTAVYTHKVGLYRRAYILGIGGSDWASKEGILRIPDPPPANSRQVVQVLDRMRLEFDSVIWWKIDGNKLGFEGPAKLWERRYSISSFTSGDHTMAVWASNDYWGTHAYFYMEGFFSQPLVAGQEFLFMENGGSVGSTLVSRHISELVLGP